MEHIEFEINKYYSGIIGSYDDGIFDIILYARMSVVLVEEEV